MLGLSKYFLVVEECELSYKLRKINKDVSKQSSRNMPMQKLQC